VKTTHYGPRARTYIHPLAGFAWLAALAGLLGACATTNAQSPSQTPTASTPSTSAPTPTPTGSATLPNLQPQQGWHTVLILGDSVSGGTISDSDSFTASTPYELVWACLGSGTLKITYGPTPQGQITKTTTCGSRSTQQVAGPFTPSSSGQQVTLEVSAEGQVNWEGLAEVQG
jgi:hypothetical protein